MGWAPDSCTLPAGERPLREAEFDVVFARSLAPPHRDRPTRLLVRLPAGDAEAVGHLAARADLHAVLDARCESLVSCATPGSPLPCPA
ncbi:hypothetical protein [Pseudonocardia sp.]|uniref:hypothetical protein n=1 Tax=Pseudonocardia sp. TaxID=60912 RepID=UPI003D14CFD1